MSADDEVSMVRELVDLFLQSAPERMAQIRESVSDPRQLSFHAHALKSMSLNLGAKKIVEICQKLEQVGASADLSAAPGVLRELDAAFAQSRLHLLAFRDA
jgi:HPt (histidine-containing phosphotransfer) domain-containing protein